MAIGEAELLRIGDYVKGNLRSWLEETGFRQPAPDPVSNTYLLERVVRVEDELKAQRELMAVRFDAMDRRFEDVLGRMDDRFAAVDNRFQAVDKRFEDILGRMDERAAAVDSRFEDVLGRMDDRFAAADKRTSLLQWLAVTAIALLGGIIGLITLAS